MKEQKKCVPEIRFAGFTDDWEQRKLGDVLTESRIIGSNGAVAKKLTVKLWKKGVIAKEEQYAGSLATQYFVRKSGQFIYGKLDFLNQAFGIIPKELDGYESTLDSPAFDISKQVNENFLLEYIARDSFYLLHGNIANGSRKAKRIHSHTLLNMPFIAPNLEEQTAIGNFFKQLDDTIALHQRTLEKYQKLKISYLEKMFPKENEQFPELRFPNFTDAWEQRKLGEVVNTFEYGLNVEAKEFDGVNKYIRITDIDDESRKFLQKDLTSPNIDIQKALEYKLVLGDILFARTGASVGKTYLFDKKDGSLYFAGFLIRANIKESFNANFIFQNTLTKNFDNFVSITSQRSGQPGINAKEYASFEFLCPSLAEQTAIGNFFKQLDDTIALHQREVEKYKKIKQAYLEKMFI